MPNKPRSPNRLPGNRKRWAFSQQELAHLLGRSSSVVSRYESGEVAPAARTVVALEIVFGRSTRHLFPTLHQEMEEVIMRRAAKLDRELRGRDDKASVRKRALLSAMIRRGGGIDL